MMKSKYQQYKAYQLNGGTMSAQEWEADGRYDASLEKLDQSDLANFKQWLSKVAIPCPRFKFNYAVNEHTIDQVELSTPEYISLTGSPFHFKTHDVIACSNPKCDAVFSYSELSYNELYLRLTHKDGNS